MLRILRSRSSMLISVAPVCLYGVVDLLPSRHRRCPGRRRPAAQPDPGSGVRASHISSVESMPPESVNPDWNVTALAQANRHRTPRRATSIRNRCSDWTSLMCAGRRPEGFRFKVTVGRNDETGIQLLPAGCPEKQVPLSWSIRVPRRPTPRSAPNLAADRPTQWGTDRPRLLKPNKPGQRLATRKGV